MILEVDGHEVWNDGTLSLRDKETIDFSYLITSRVEGATTIKVLREGKDVPTPVNMYTQQKPQFAPDFGPNLCVHIPRSR